MKAKHEWIYYVGAAFFSFVASAAFWAIIAYMVIQAYGGM